ncbi:MAG: septal ring lytic transglycosylase RlpA family protein [Chthoniobacterales bacterium]
MRQFFQLAILVCISGIFGACSQHEPPPRYRITQEEVYSTKKVLRGKASYYYGRWIGRLTANGETYRRNDMTAAHKTLPFNTMVRVTNLQNGREVIVRINNRGPYVRGRIIDMSLAAAKELQMEKAGVVPVTVEVLEKISDDNEPERGT